MIIADIQSTQPIMVIAQSRLRLKLTDPNYSLTASELHVLKDCDIYRSPLLTHRPYLPVMLNTK